MCACVFLKEKAREGPAVTTRWKEPKRVITSSNPCGQMLINVFNCKCPSVKKIQNRGSKRKRMRIEAKKGPLSRKKTLSRPINRRHFNAEGRERENGSHLIWRECADV
jgi:hypothetical protein